jgi:hypothetical protein
MMKRNVRIISRNKILDVCYKYTFFNMKCIKQRPPLWSSGHSPWHKKSPLPVFPVTPTDKSSYRTSVRMTPTVVQCHSVGNPSFVFRRHTVRFSAMAQLVLIMIFMDSLKSFKRNDRTLP